MAEIKITPVHAELGTYCAICGETFPIAHLSDRRILCPNCQAILKEIVAERKDTPQTDQTDCAWTWK